MPRMPLLEVENLVKSYSGRRVVDRVSFHVDEGEIVGLLGRNGAGKTTSFRMAIGMISPEEGTVRFGGKAVTGLAMYQHARLGMGYLSQEPSVFQRLSVQDNLMAVLETTDLDKHAQRSRCRELLEQFGLEHKSNELARTCSGGERRRLEIARAMVTRPRLLLLDEWLAGLNPTELQTGIALIAGLRDEGRTIILVEHVMHAIRSLCDRCVVMNSGTRIAEGPPAQVLSEPEVVRAYLGDEVEAEKGEAAAG